MISSENDFYKNRRFSSFSGISATRFSIKIDVFL